MQEAKARRKAKRQGSKRRAADLGEVTVASWHLRRGTFVQSSWAVTENSQYRGTRGIVDELPELGGSNMEIDCGGSADRQKQPHTDPVRMGRRGDS
ncbi:MAG: hypothetical protein Q9214_002211 [Letrouitia sp. 1 TL-2023]